MGQFIFDVAEPLQPLWSQSLWPSAYLCGIEGVPWFTHSRLDAGRLIVQREIDDSGKLFVPWPIAGQGVMMQSTCSLRPATKPYSLPLELARGACFGVRNQSDIWSRSGMRLTEPFHQRLSEATSMFLDASGCAGCGVQAGEAALASLGLLHSAAEELCEAYASQAIAFRCQHESRLGTLLAGTLLPEALVSGRDEPRHAGDFATAFNSASVRISWGDIESDAGRYDFDRCDAAVAWAAKGGMKLIGGPLIDFHDRLTPHWVYVLEDNFEGLLDSIHHFVETTVRRYKGQIQIWNAASGLNLPGPISLNDEQLMRVAVTILQSIRRNDPQTPAIVSFDQPFGEYLAHHRDGISPLHFADALVRSGLGMAGVGIELRIGYEALGTIPRSTLQIAQLIDRWAQLGMPMLVQLAMPASTSPDPLARRPSGLIGGSVPTAIGEVEQTRRTSAILRALLAKQFVHAIVWEGWDDTQPHLVSHAGLWDPSGPRTLLEYFKRVRRDLLH